MISSARAGIATILLSTGLIADNSTKTATAKWVTTANEWVDLITTVVVMLCIVITVYIQWNNRKK